MRTPITLGSVALILALLPAAVLAFREQRIVITPENAARYQLEISHGVQEGSTVNSVHEFAVSKIENSVADLSNSCTSFLTPSRQIPAPLDKTSETTAVERTVEEVDGGRRWTCNALIEESLTSRTYLEVPPPTNLSDGTTFVIDLPAFRDLSDVPGSAP